MIDVIRARGKFKNRPHSDHEDQDSYKERFGSRDSNDSTW